MEKCVLLSLTLSSCHLKVTFATAAALQLRTDSRLQKLDVRNNPIIIGGVYTIVKALEVNKCLETLAITIVESPPELEVRQLFDLIKERQVSARLNIHWEQPRGCDFAEGVLLCSASSSNMDLGTCSIEDASALLNALASSRNTHAARIECNRAFKPVIAKLVETVGSTTYLRKLTLGISLREDDEISLLQSLEGNRTIRIFELSKFLYKKKMVRALGQLVERNRVINVLTILVQQGYDSWNIVKAVCNEMKEAVPRNHVLIVVNVQFFNINQSKSFEVKEALRRNMMHVHDAIRFINGSSQKSDALAFEELQHAYSLKYVLSSKYGLTEATAIEKIDEARNRLAADYLVLTGVVSGRVTCEMDRGRRPTLGDLAVDVLARVCSFLHLNDVRNN
ncbi:hypothetical protein HPB49_005591 [Dermacentor silvarum]|uniref:Uncharacterized protein n=1 Tax=Dermacentor silvarum TaxID=543639 RepID=A0ACB8DNB0_DERSI|nr:hypothetical protein HPB49_005591 [Dermacentor silvarum]